jgi:hypothetical protein
MTHEPTSSGPPHHVPTTCYACGRRAHGIGFGTFGRDGKGDPHFLCENCIPLMAQIKATTRWDAFEQRALEATIEMVGPIIETNGPDLSEWTAEQVEEFVGAVILSFGTSIREQVRSGSVPF